MAADASQKTGKRKEGEVILSAPDGDRRASHAYAEIFGIKYSPLSRKIVTFNLVALCLMMTGILYFNQIDDDLIRIRERSLETDARFVSEMLSLRAFPVANGEDIPPATSELFLRLAETSDGYVQLYDAAGRLVARTDIPEPENPAPTDQISDETIDGLLAEVSGRIKRLFFADDRPPLSEAQRVRLTRSSMESALSGNLRRARENDIRGEMMITVALPVIEDGSVAGAVVISTEPGEIEAIVRQERLQILRIFFMAMVINVILSVALANTVAHPLQELAEAAEKGGAMNTRRLNPERIEIPDLTGRPDEIGLPGWRNEIDDDRALRPH